MRNHVIFYSVIPAIRIFTGDNNIMAKSKAEDYPTVAKVEFYPSMGGGTIISLQTALGTEVTNVLVTDDYARFEEYAQIVNGLPIMGAKIDHPIYRIATTVRVDSATIELEDYNRNENVTHFAKK
ncbi:hypothetical protein D9M68_18320 [compost metagenome]